MSRFWRTGAFRSSVTIAVLLVMVSLPALAVWQETHWMSCTGGACANNSRMDYYIDDCNGKAYVIWVHCDCTTTIQFFTTIPSPGPLTYPSNFDQMCAAADLTTPGAYTGIYVYDASNHQILLRNPYNQAEVDEVYNCPGLQ